jgi:hypothetical protein
MNGLVKRIKNNGDTTIGELYIDGVFECDTLEDEPRKVKVRGETRIPAGTYEIKLRTAGSFHAKYSERFKDIHHGMLHITNVPGFDYILIHCGNTDEDTAGCLLVGEAQEWILKNSTAAYKKLYLKISGALLKNEKVFITYMDEE